MATRASKTTEYTIWYGMVRRCTRTYDKDYKFYGGRGITVCDRWLGRGGFSNFLADMGFRPGKLTLDRVDNSKGYGPDNCRWTSMLEQSNNTRKVRRLEYGGEVLSVSQWARKLNIDCRLLSHRIHRGWSVERALTTPVHSAPSPGAMAATSPLAATADTAPSLAVPAQTPAAEVV